jgi:beta-glucosidase
MAEARFSFPSEFMWGTATAAHQVEGYNTNNNWYTWENEGHIINGHKSGAACDWWGGRWQEDFDRAAETGQKAHRLSIEWSRIEPEPDQWDEDAIDHYREMMGGLVKRGLAPMVTLHHFTDPLWLTEIGGWENGSVVGYFQRFVEKVVESLKEFVTLWCTINEPNVLAVSSYLLGDFPPGEKNFQAVYKVIQNLILAHAAAYHKIHDIQPHAKVGLAHHYRGFSPAKSRRILDKRVAGMFSKMFNDVIPQVLVTGVLRLLGKRDYVSAAKSTQDFFGINYYTREYVAFSPFAPRNLFSKRFLDPKVEHSTSGGIANEPTTFFQALKWAESFGLPIYVTENGIDDAEDLLRPKYLAQHLHQMWRGVNFNWPVKGYFHWTLVDNFEWERGWTQRFGLWELDIETQARQKRKSAELFEAICKENALSTAMVAKYVPELVQIMFPG